MRYWVFNEDQLVPALLAWGERRTRTSSEQTPTSALPKWVADFLTSHEAREAGILKGTEEGPAT